MRWIMPRDGDTKIEKKFAILPIKIKNETRWLEWVTVKYQYCECSWPDDISCWVPEEFIDEE